MQEYEPVVEHRQLELLEQVELDGYLIRESAYDLPAQRGPRNAVGGATGHMIHVNIVRNVDLLNKMRIHINIVFLARNEGDGWRKRTMVI